MNMLVAAIAIAASTATAPHETQGWTADYAVALQATRADQKPLLVLIDRPEDPVNGSEEAVLRTGDEVLAEALDEYTLCYVDATTEYGERVADVFKVSQYPFAAIIDRDGRKILEKWTGSREAWQWAAALGEQNQTNGNGYLRAATGGYTTRANNGRTASRACYT